MFFVLSSLIEPILSLFYFKIANLVTSNDLMFGLHVSQSGIILENAPILSDA